MSFYFIINQLDNVNIQFRICTSHVRNTYLVLPHGIIKLAFFLLMLE